MRLLSHIGKDDAGQTYCCDHSYHHIAMVCCKALFHYRQTDTGTHIHRPGLHTEEVFIKMAECLLHVLDVVLIVSCNDIATVSSNVSEASIPASPVSDCHTSIVIANCSQNDESPIEWNEQFTRCCRMHTDERIYRLPFPLCAIYGKELLHVVVANKLMYATTVNHLQYTAHYLFHTNFKTKCNCLCHKFS